MFTQVHWTEISCQRFLFLNKTSSFKTYSNTNNVSNLYMTDCKWGLSCPGSYLYLPADAGRTLFPWGGISSSAVLNSFGFLFWSIYQQKSKANFCVRFQASVLIGKRRSYQDSTLLAEGPYHWEAEKCSHILTVSHTMGSCFFCPTSTSSGKSGSVLTSSQSYL